MLDQQYCARMTALLESLECRVRLPEAWAGDYFNQRGHMPPVWDDRRRFVRHRYRAKAILELETSLPDFPREHAHYAIYTRDLSRSGFSFLHCEQLFPGEEVSIWLPTHMRCYTIVSCQRLNDACFQIGAETGRRVDQPVPQAENCVENERSPATH